MNGLAFGSEDLSGRIDLGKEVHYIIKPGATTNICRINLTGPSSTHENPRMGVQAYNLLRKYVRGTETRNHPTLEIKQFNTFTPPLVYPLSTVVGVRVA